MLAGPPGTLLLLALLGAFSRPSAPAAPSGLAADAVLAPKPSDALRVHVRLTWTDHASNETAFTVERTRVGGTWHLILCGPNETVLLDEGVGKGEVYEYRVFAVNDFGNSRPSNVVRVAADPRHP